MSGETTLYQVETDTTLGEGAWKLAVTQWWKKLPYRGASRVLLWENVEEMIPSQFTLERILASDVYTNAVKYIMLGTRTAEQFHKWINTFRRPAETLGDRMGLSPKRMQRIIDEVTKERNYTAH
ncbi:MAG: hypothetical protein OXH00_04950 [Candidatus Poribacteria bacterium]|nr:hypothetical protein [Candidatus Poribacteria bacterium]